ncbi:tRNA-splicing endonuclease subunit [Mortierella sp. NVP85]|nr:tRNA-splicing endonuclease subunit [Mortierella sp. NVP85]
MDNLHPLGQLVEEHQQQAQQQPQQHQQPLQPPPSPPSPPPTSSVAPTSHRKPLIHLTGSEALVWDVNDIRELRQRHRIVGSLAGSLSRSPMQNVFQGLPLRLLPEEAFTLWRNGLADFVDERRSYGQQSSSTLIEPHSADTSGKNAHVALPTMSSGLPYYTPFLARPFATMDTEHTQGGQGSSDPTSSHNESIDSGSMVLFGASAREQERRAVFMHLWETQEFFLAPGMKFGGDYLLYRGDPLICHASLIATVEDGDKPLPLADLASSARLSSTVQKQRLFCSLTQRHDSSLAHVSPTLDTTLPKRPQVTKSDVLKFVIEWAGF